MAMKFLTESGVEHLIGKVKDENNKIREEVDVIPENLLVGNGYKWVAISAISKSYPLNGKSDIINENIFNDNRGLEKNDQLSILYGISNFPNTYKNLLGFKISNKLYKNKTYTLRVGIKAKSDESIEKVKNLNLKWFLRYVNLSSNLTRGGEYIDDFLEDNDYITGSNYALNIPEYEFKKVDNDNYSNDGIVYYECQIDGKDFLERNLDSLENGEYLMLFIDDQATNDGSSECFMKYSYITPVQFYQGKSSVLTKDRSDKIIPKDNEDDFFEKMLINYKISTWADNDKFKGGFKDGGNDKESDILIIAPGKMYYWQPPNSSVVKLIIKWSNVNNKVGECYIFFNNENIVNENKTIEISGNNYKIGNIAISDILNTSGDYLIHLIKINNRIIYDISALIK